MQWWWGRPRASDELALPVWFDELGPVAAAGLASEKDGWQVDVFAVPSIVDEEEVWAATLTAAAEQRWEMLEVPVFGGNTQLADLAVKSGFEMTEGVSGTTWMDADQRPPVAPVDDFTVVDRTARGGHPHPTRMSSEHEFSTQRTMRTWRSTLTIRSTARAWPTARSLRGLAHLAVGRDPQDHPLRLAEPPCLRPRLRRCIADRFADQGRSTRARRNSSACASGIAATKRASASVGSSAVARASRIALAT